MASKNTRKILISLIIGVVAACVSLNKFSEMQKEIKEKEQLIEVMQLRDKQLEKTKYTYLTATHDMEAGEAIKGEGAKPIYCIQPAILRHKDGRLQVVCRTRNAKIATSWSSDNGETWSKVTLLDIESNNSGIDAVTLADGRHVMAYNNFETIPGTPKGARTPLSIAVSSDGIVWKHVVTLEDSPVSQYSYPAIIQASDGKIHVVYTWRRQRIKHDVIDLNK